MIRSVIYERAICAFVCAAAIFCLPQSAPAQSGRVQRKPTPPPVTTASETIKPPVPINSLRIGGLIVHDSAYFRSNYLDAVQDACRDRLKEAGIKLEVTNLGKMTRQEAIGLAKMLTTTYVLWMEVRIENEGIWGDDTIRYVEYFVFKPLTAEVLAQGKVDPNNQDVVISGTRLPSVRKRTLSETQQLKAGGQKVADSVRRKL